MEKPAPDPEHDFRSGTEVAGNDGSSAAFWLAGLTAVLYATAALVWIYVSDRALELVFDGPGEITRFQIIKGTGFVAFTSLALFWGLYVLLGRLAATRAKAMTLSPPQRELIDALPDPVFMLDSFGRIVELNKASLDALGRNLHDVIGTHALRMVAATNYALAAKALYGALSGAEQNIRCLILTRDGARPYRVHGRPLVSPDGTVTRVLCIAQDLTEEIRSAKTLGQARERLSLALEAAEIGTWEWDLRTDEMSLSAEWKGLIGFSDHEIPNAFGVATHRVHPEDRERVLAALQDAIADPDRHHDIEFRFLHRNGTYRWISGKARGRRDDAGKTTHIIGTNIDITEKKELELALREALARAEAANTAKTALLRYMGHELRTPLNAVIGFSEILLAEPRDKLDPKQRSYVEDILSSGKHLLYIIDGLIEIARLGPGTDDGRKQLVDWHEIATSAIAIARMANPHTQAQIENTVPKKKAYLATEPRAISRAVADLILFWLMFSKPPHHISLRLETTGERQANLRIANIGSEVKKELLDELNRSIENIGDVLSQTTMRDSLHLRFQIAYHLIQAHGGRIHAASEPNRETAIIVSFPQHPTAIGQEPDQRTGPT